MQRLLSTSEFAVAVGISESSARRLADSGQLQVQRSKGGHRKIPVSEAIKYVRETKVRVARPDLLGLAREFGDGAKRMEQSPSTWSDRLLASLLDGHYQSVIGLIQAMYLDGMAIAAICDGPIRFAMNEIGSTWPQDKRSIFIEHRATVLCVRALCQIRASLPAVDAAAPMAMGAAPQEDPYLLPSLMASLVLHECGYNEVNLGPNTPIDVLADSAEDERPDVVWLAVTNPIRSRTHHREIENLSEVVNGYGGALLIGGRNASTFTGEGAEFCSSMVDMMRRVAT